MKRQEKGPAPANALVVAASQQVARRRDPGPPRKLDQMLKLLCSGNIHVIIGSATSGELLVLWYDWEREVACAWAATWFEPRKLKRVPSADEPARVDSVRMDQAQLTEEWSALISDDPNVYETPRLRFVHSHFTGVTLDPVTGLKDRYSA